MQSKKKSIDESNNRLTNKNKSPQGFGTTTREPKQSLKTPKSMRIPLIFTDTQYKYWEVLASKNSQNVGAYLLDLLENHLDSKLLIGDLEWIIPDEHRPNRELTNILKALIYGNLDENDKLTKEDLEKVSRLIGCQYNDLITLLEKIN